MIAQATWGALKAAVESLDHFKSNNIWIVANIDEVRRAG
jgi:hypothetical protein